MKKAPKHAAKARISTTKYLWCLSKGAQLDPVTNKLRSVGIARHGKYPLTLKPNTDCLCYRAYRNAPFLIFFVFCSLLLFLSSLR